MPPKKRAKPTLLTPSKDTSAAATPSKDLAPAHTTATDILADPWTDDQETSLFKSVIRWKPTGVHKHMHMIQIATAMCREGFAYPGGGRRLEHTRIPGIWRKLGELYDLEALDERENAFIFAGSRDWAEEVGGKGSEDDDEDEGEGTRKTGFVLPGDEYAQMMWDRRIPDSEDEGEAKPKRKKKGRPKGTRSESPPALPELLPKKGDPPPSDFLHDHGNENVEKDETRASAVSPPPKLKSSARAGTRGAAAAKSKPSKGRGARAQSSEPDAEEDEDEDEDEDEEEEEEESSEEVDEDETPPAKDSSGRGGRGGRRGGRATKRGRRR